MPGPSGFMKISAVVPRSRPVSPVTRAPERMPISAPAHVAALSTAVIELQHALANVRTYAPALRTSAVPTAQQSAAWRGGYQQALSGLDAIPPAMLTPRVSTTESVTLLASFRDGYAQGAKEQRQRHRCATLAQAYQRCSLVDRGIAYRAWPAGVSVAGKRPPLTGHQVRLMSQAAVQSYHALAYAEVPVAED